MRHAMLLKRVGLFVLACGLSWSAEVTLVLVDGDEVAGPLEEAGPAGYTVGGKKVGLEDVDEIRFGGAPKPAGARHRILFRNGDHLFADITEGGEKGVKLTHETLGELALKPSSLKAILFAGGAPANQAAIDAFLAEKDPDEDKVLTVKGETLSGFMEGFSEKELSFDIGGQKRVLPYTEAAAFRFAVLEPYKPREGVRAQVRLTDGSVVSGKPSALERETLVLEGLEGAAWRIPATAIVAVSTRGGKLVYLSELKPSAVEEKPLIGGMPVIRHWRANASVSGEPLRINRKEFAKGVGVRAFTRLTYPLDGAYRIFTAEVGLDDASTSPGACSYRVIADGKELASGEAKAGEAARKLKLEVAGVKTLELVCDYGPDQDDAGDHFDWANARLVK